MYMLSVSCFILKTVLALVWHDTIICNTWKLQLLFHFMLVSDMIINGKDGCEFRPPCLTVRVHLTSCMT